jgi:hypothetical protein
MGQQIIKQPDGRFTVFCSITDTIAVYDATAADVVEYFAEQARRNAVEAARRLVSLVDAGKPREAYHQFAMTWDEALQKDREHDGEAWTEFEGRPLQDEEQP